MSTSSALASAKRRRAAVANQPVSGSNQILESELEPEQKPKFTPIQLLQLHEIRIKKLESLLPDHAYNNNNNNNNNNNKDIDIERHVEKSLANMKKMIENKSDLTREYIEELIDSKILNKQSSVSNNDINQMIDLKVVDIRDKINSLVNDLKELDTFKNMLIKNQSDIIDNNNMLNVVSMKINTLITQTVDADNNDSSDSDNDNENESFDMAEMVKLFKQMNGGEELLEKFVQENDIDNTINIENENLHVLDSVINIEKIGNNTHNEPLLPESIINDNDIKKIDISDDEQGEDIKLFQNISEKIKEEISEETKEHVSVKKNTNNDKNTHEIIEEEAHAVIN